MFNVPPQTEDLIEVEEGEKREININAIRNIKEKTIKEQNPKETFPMFLFLLLFLLISSRK